MALYRTNCPLHQEKLGLFCSQCLQYRCDLCEDKHIGTASIIHGSQINQVTQLLIHSQNSSQLMQSKKELLLSLDQCISNITLIREALAKETSSSNIYPSISEMLSKLPNAAVEMIAKIKPSQEMIQSIQTSLSKEVSINKCLCKLVEQLHEFLQNYKEISKTVRVKQYKIATSPIYNSDAISSSSAPENYKVIQQNIITPPFNTKSIQYFISSTLFSFDNNIIRRVSNEDSRRALYINYRIHRGEVKWKVKVNSIAQYVGVGISSDLNSQYNNEHFLYSDNEHSGLANTGRYGIGDILVMTLNMDTREFRINGPTFEAVAVVTKEAYYPCFSLYRVGDELSLI